MKRKILCIVALLCVIITKAEDVVQVVPFQTTAGVTYDDEATFDVNMNNSQDYQALQFDLYVPEWIIIYTEGVEANKDRMPGPNRNYSPYHTVTITNKGEGHYVVIVVDIQPGRTSYFKGTEGTLFSMYYETTNDVEPGVYPIRIEGTVLSVNGTTDVKPVTSISYVKIGDLEKNKIYDLGNELLVPSFVNEALSEDANIVVNGVCKKLLLTDGSTFSPLASFTAESATYDAVVSTSLGYKTLVLPYECPVPAGFEAYEVGGVVNGELQMNAITTIPTNTPVILKNAGTATMAATNVEIVPPLTELTGGELVGTYEEIDAPVGSYVLQNQGGNVAFYKVGEAVRPKVGVFRAYLAQLAAGPQHIRMNFNDEQTGIDRYEEENADAQVYNLSGQRIGNAQRGVNIIREGNRITKTIINK